MKGGLPISSGQKWYALGLLTVITVFSYLDRQSLAILQVPIKHDLGLSDTQLGALTGLAFSLLYSTLALPIARLADRKSRKILIAVALAIWSLMTAASGLAVGFITLVICRMGVALGEAACAPATLSLIADYFPRQRRPTAIAIWSLGLPIGIMLGFAVSGWLSTLFGWRIAFLVLGLIGLSLVPLALLTLREPMRGATDGVAAGEVPTLRVAVKTLWSIKAYRHGVWGGSLLTYTLYATMNWNASFYSRVYGLSMRDLAVYLALVAGIGGGAGMALGGILGDRLGARDSRWYMGVPAMAALGVAPLLLIQYLTPNLYLSLGVGILSTIFINAYLPSLMATLQSLVQGNLRAFAAAVMVLVLNIIGSGFGPIVTGMISDRLISHYGITQDSLRYAIPSSALFALWAAYHFIRASSYLPAELPSHKPKPVELADNIVALPRAG